MPLFFPTSFNSLDVTNDINWGGAAYVQTTPTPTSSVGILASVSSTVRAKKFGKRVHVIINVHITTVGTGSGQLTIALPYTPLNPTAGAASCTSNSAITLSAFAYTNGQAAIIPSAGALNSGYDYQGTFDYEI